ncbi:MAG: PIG-L family deacetylase [Desulforegulaceae bacterium]|nr:PIG-L family deacetylase [Desulforegulaceae bacterium]
MRVLFISVHPDDETLGCGGTILKHRKNNDEIYWLIITGVSAGLGYSDEFIDRRRKEILQVSGAYGFKDVINLDFPAARLNNVDFSLLLDKISEAVQAVKPHSVYTINRTDIHTDHQIAAKAVMSSLKSFRAPFVKRVLMYECISETEIAFPLPENLFIPNSYSDITEFIDEKIKIMKIYSSEVQEAPYPRSIENIKSLARFRGSCVCTDFAEAFMLLRDVF